MPELLSGEIHDDNSLIDGGRIMDGGHVSADGGTMINSIISGG